MLNFLKTGLVFFVIAWLTGFKSIQIEAENDSTSTLISSGKIKTVVLDAGHGGKDPGCSGSTGTREKDVALEIVLALGRRIKEAYPSVKVYYTRQSDVFVNLHERSSIANRHRANLFISIHCNASTSHKLHGTETYTMGLHKTQNNLDVAKRENAVIFQERDYKKNYKGFDNSPLSHIMMANYQNAFMMNSLKFAQKIERQLRVHTDRHSYGVKQAGFLVLWETAMPSVLIETGFLSNPEEEDYLSSEEGQNGVAEAIFRAFKSYKQEIEN